MHAGAVSPSCLQIVKVPPRHQLTSGRAADWCVDEKIGSSGAFVGKKLLRFWHWANSVVHGERTPQLLVLLNKHVLHLSHRLNKINAKKENNRI